MTGTAAPYDLTRVTYDYPAWDGPPRRTVLLCTHPRSGSTLLGEALYFAGGLGCPLEYFHAGFRPGLARRWGSATLAEHVRAAHRWRTDPGGTFGVKLFWRDVVELAAELAPDRFAGLEAILPGQLSPASYRALAALLDDLFPRPRFVHLLRSDRVRLAVSGLAAVQTGRWRVVAGTAAPPPRGGAIYDFEQIERYIAQADLSHAHWRAFFAAIGVVPIEVTYEALTSDYAATVAATLARLGSGAAVPPIRLERQSDACNEAFVLRFLRDRAASG